VLQGLKNIGSVVFV